MSQNSEKTVLLPADLHARPAGEIARAAAKFDADVTLKVGPKQAKAASVLMLMSLGATAGTEVFISADGPQAEDAVEALSQLLMAVAPA